MRLPMYPRPINPSLTEPEWPSPLARRAAAPRRCWFASVICLLSRTCSSSAGADLAELFDGLVNLIELFGAQDHIASRCIFQRLFALASSYQGVRHARLRHGPGDDHLRDGRIMFLGYWFKLAQNFRNPLPVLVGEPRVVLAKIVTRNCRLAVTLPLNKPFASGEYARNAMLLL